MHTPLLLPLRSALAVGLLLVGQSVSVMHVVAAWTPAEGSVTPPAVLTVDVFEFSPPGTRLPSDPSFPIGPLVVGSDGALYGLTVQGGSFGYGTAFKVSTGGTFTRLHDFDIWPSTDGFLPSTSLVNGPDGNLYGSTPDGGSGAGVLFRLASNGTFTKLHQFDGTDGANPLTPMVVGPDGALYGSTWQGGAIGAGMLFRLGTDGTFTLLHEFNGADGANFNINYDTQEYPYSALTLGPDGALYGATPFGGTTFQGTLFKVQTDGTFTKLHDFSGLDGWGQKSPLVVGADGALYGTTASSLFKVEANGTFTLLHDCGFAPLVLGPDGAVYGADGGRVFKVETNGTFSTVHSFYSDSTVNGADLRAPLVVGPDGALYGATFAGGTYGLGTLFRLEINGAFTKLHDFNGINGAQPNSALVVGVDGALYGTTFGFGPRNGGILFKLVLPPPRPVIQHLAPSQAIAGAGDVSMMITGLNFESGSRVFFGSVEVTTVYVSPTQLQVTVPAAALPSPVDFATVAITAQNPNSDVSHPAAFTVIGAGVSGSVGQVQSGVAGVGETATVQTPPSAPDSAGVTASLENSSGTTPATVTAATYTENPTPAPAFEAGGGFVDLQVSGADPGDRLSSSFYYPQTVTGAAETGLKLKFFNGTVWVDVLSSGGVAPTKNTTDNLEGTVSGGLFWVVFDNSSTPKITELNGTVFAVAIPDTTSPTVSCPNVTVPCNASLLVPVTYPSPTVSDDIDPTPRVTYSIPSGSSFGVGSTTVTCTVTDAAGNTKSTTFTVTRAPLGFTGFHSPIGGADATGGSFASPVRTFKYGSTIPVKFSAACGGTSVATGVHRLQAIKYSDATTGGTPIDATPQEAATTGNQFRLSDQEWHFNLDTKSTGVTKGIWQLVATLSDGSQHMVWVQIK